MINLFTGIRLKLELPQKYFYLKHYNFIENILLEFITTITHKYETKYNKNKIFENILLNIFILLLYILIILKLLKFR